MSPTGTHWLNFVYVNIGFLMIGVIMAYIISMKEIKDNWGKYRCNPMFMMFSDDISGDFQQCIAKTQETSLNQMMTGYVDQLNEVNSAISDNASKLESSKSDLSDFKLGMDADFGGVSYSDLAKKYTKEEIAAFNDVPDNYSGKPTKNKKQFRFRFSYR